MITVYHISRGQAPKLMLSSGRSLLLAATEAWKNGHYQKVATVDGYNLEKAWEKTNNVHNSWSMDENPGVKVESPLHVINGKILGLRSTMVGDIFVLDDKAAFVVDISGFTILHVKVK